VSRAKRLLEYRKILILHSEIIFAYMLSTFEDFEVKPQCLSISKIFILYFVKRNLVEIFSGTCAHLQIYFIVLN
jgi:hypothetical protein